MTSKVYLVSALALIWSCAAKDSGKTESLTDSDSTQVDTSAASLIETGYAKADSLSFDEDISLTAEEVYGDEGDDFTGDDPYPEGIRESDGVVHFVDGMYSDSSFPVGLFWKNGNAEDDVPEFLRANNIEYTVKKIEADPDSPESTDIYTYSFDGSVIEIAYGQVTSATIVSPLLELERGIKVGMTKNDFMANFTYLEQHRSNASFQLHTSSIGSACWLLFDFKDDVLASIMLEIFIQDCG